MFGKLKETYLDGKNWTFSGAILSNLVERLARLFVEEERRAG